MSHTPLGNSEAAQAGTTLSSEVPDSIGQKKCKARQNASRTRRFQLSGGYAKKVKRGVPVVANESDWLS